MATTGDKPQETGVAEVIPLKGWRKILAERMLASHTQYAEVTQMREVDATEMVNLRKAVVADLEKQHGVRVTFTHMIIKAAAAALKQHPIVNSTLAGEEIKVLSDINIAMAVSLDDGGLLSPVIRNVDKKNLVEVAKDSVAVTEGVRTKKFKLDILQGGTFTVTNAGMFGTDYVTVLLNIPQSAALGVGRLMAKPVVRDGQIVIRTMMGLSVTYDHRVLTGAVVAQFFQTLQDNIEKISKASMGI